MAAAATHLTAKKRARFLDTLAECGNVSQAAKVAATSRDSVYRLRADDAVFASAWDDALQSAADKLEQEAWRRAHDGVEEPLTCARGLITDADGNPVTVRKYSDTLLIFLLKGARPEKYREHLNVTAQATSLGITVVLEQMRNDRTLVEQAADFVGLLESTGQAEG